MHPHSHAGLPEAGRLAGLHAAAVDLLWGSRCVACDRPGAGLCPDCRHLIEPPPPRTLTAATGDSLTVYAAGRYADVLAAAVPAFKERELRGLGRPLGAALADAVVRALAASTSPRPSTVWLVPVPPSRRSRRERGFAPGSVLARQAARRLRAAGVPARLAPAALRYRREVADQAGLGAGERASNLDGALAAGSGAVLAVLGRAGAGNQPVLLVDDVVTTGATLLEAARALREAGVWVSAAAVVADTPRAHAG